MIGIALRWVGLGSSVPTFDETFGAGISRLPVGDMFEYLREADWHPPLDYLVRRPLVGSYSAFWLRGPSAAAGTATLIAVALWMRRSGWLGVAVVTLTSFATIQLLYARTARMYAFLILGGTILAIVSDRWLDRPRTRWAVAAGVTLFFTALAQQVVLFMVPGLLLVAGRRRDREAWVWRAWVMGGAVAWLVVWGPTFLDQMSVRRTSWIPLTTPRGIYDAVTGQVTLSPALQFIVFAATIVGGALLVRRHPRLGRVWLYVLVVPAVVVMVIGLQVHVLLPRSISFAALAPVLAFGAIVEWLLDDPPLGVGRVVTVPAAVAVLLLGSASAWSAVSYEEDLAPLRSELVASASPGDVVAVHPRFLGPILEWDLQLPRESISVPGLDSTETWTGRLPGMPTGRAWILVPDTYGRPAVPPSAVPCPDAPVRVEGPATLHCLDGFAST